MSDKRWIDEARERCEVARPETQISAQLVRTDLPHALACLAEAVELLEGVDDWPHGESERWKWVAQWRARRAALLEALTKGPR